jgi:hypothetical protein
MPQHTLPGVVQSVSALQSCSPSCAFRQLRCAAGSRLVTTHACPVAESHVVSFAQNCGQLAAAWQTFPADP